MDRLLDGNVCLLSWEHLILFLENDIKETKTFSLDINMEYQ